MILLNVVLFSSIIMQAEIPNSINELFYYSNVYVGLKNPIFELSSILRYASDYNIIVKTNKSYLFLYTNSGPDHQVKFVRTQITFISLFLALDLDYLVA